MAKRTQEELAAHPCFFKLRDFEKPVAGQMQKVKQTVPKLDENGKPVFKEIEVKVKKSCGCKNKDGSAQTEMVKQQIPETMEIMVDQPVSGEDGKMIICKLFGTVKRSHCENCHTYKVKPT